MGPCYSRGMYFSVCKELQSRLEHADLSSVLRVSQSSCRTGLQQEVVFVALKKQYLGKMHFSCIVFGNDHRCLSGCVPFSSGHCLGYLLQLSFNLSSTLNQLVRHHSQNSRKNAKSSCVSVPYNKPQHYLTSLFQ